MAVLVEKQSVNNRHSAWWFKPAPAQKRKRMSEQDMIGATLTPTSNSAASTPARKRFTGSLLQKYASELAVFESFTVQLSESDCPYL
eukprot:scaffold9851_cov186-Cylindrotheca_fusiformis.AAC.1